MPPEPYECCESGCDPCVHDTYARASKVGKRVSEHHQEQEKRPEQ